MTTIAYRAGVMACDSCYAFGNMVDTLSPKVHRLRSGALLGQAGANDSRSVVALFDQVCRDVATLPDAAALKQLDVDFMGLLVFPAEPRRLFKVSIDEIAKPTGLDTGIWEIEAPFTAIGSGESYAIGAFEAGADAVRAVEIACRRDINSRPPIHVFNIKGE